MNTIQELKEKLEIGAQMINSGEGDKKCDVCGGRAVACLHLGHRPENQRHVLWHPDDIKGGE